MGSREKILARLKAAQKERNKPLVGDRPPFENRRHIVPPETIPNLTERFVLEAEKLSCKVAQFTDSQAAVAHIIEVIKQVSKPTDHKITAWDFEYIPLPGLQEGLAQAGIAVVDSNDATVKVGITGAVAALAATGSIVVQSGKGRPRKVSLLPYTHIVVMTESQLVLDFETWVAAQNVDHFRELANTVVISGSSRTADIAMEIVLGAHGPAEVYIVMMKSNAT